MCVALNKVFISFIGNVLWPRKLHESLEPYHVRNIMRAKWNLYPHLLLHAEDVSSMKTRDSLPTLGHSRSDRRSTYGNALYPCQAQDIQAIDFGTIGIFEM